MNNIIFYLEKLRINTVNGNIPWRKLSDGTFVWQTSTSENIKTNVILQKTMSLNNMFNILFRLYEVDNKRVLMDINTKQVNDETSIAINNLFNAIENSHSNYELNILDDLLQEFE